MNEASHDIATAAAMLERARQVLELTYSEWRLHEQPRRRGKPARSKQNRYGGDRGFAMRPHYGLRAFA